MTATTMIDRAKAKPLRAMCHQLVSCSNMPQNIGPDCGRVRAAWIPGSLRGARVAQVRNRE